MPWQKGQSGNPRGRPPKAVEAAEQSVLLEEFDAEAERACVRAMIGEAKGGNVAAFKELMDRKYGREPLSGRILTLTPADLADLSDEQLDDLYRRIAAGR